MALRDEVAFLVEVLSPRRARVISRLSSPRPLLQQGEGSPCEEPEKGTEDARTPTCRAPLYWCGLLYSLHLLGIVVVPGYGGYGSDDTLRWREISVVRGVEMNHANPIVVVAR